MTRRERSYKLIKSETNALKVWDKYENLGVVTITIV